VNNEQKLWWKQARSDHALFVQLRGAGVHECHLLHYLQMATEKVSKAYFWRSGHAPPKSHTGFVLFLKALLDRRPDELDRVARVLELGRRQDLDNWVTKVQTLAYSLQNMAPSQASNGPNPEYPWPHEAPSHCPIDHKFFLWEQLSRSGQGRKFMLVVARVIERFEHIS